MHTFSDEDLKGVLAAMQEGPLQSIKDNDPANVLKEEYGNGGDERDIWRLFMKKKRPGSILAEQMKVGGLEDLMKRARFRRTTDQENE
jgi:hypothetical protein